jgi:hypothetical protein
VDFKHGDEKMRSIYYGMKYKEMEAVASSGAGVVHQEIQI